MPCCYFVGESPSPANIHPVRPGSALSGTANLCSAISDIQPAEQSTSRGQASLSGLSGQLTPYSSHSPWQRLNKGLLNLADQMPCCGADHQCIAGLQGVGRNLLWHRSHITLVFEQWESDAPNTLGRSVEVNEAIEYLRQIWALA